MPAHAPAHCWPPGILSHRAHADRAQLGTVLPPAQAASVAPRPLWPGVGPGPSWDKNQTSEGPLPALPQRPRGPGTSVPLAPALVPLTGSRGHQRPASRVQRPRGAEVRSPAAGSAPRDAAVSLTGDPVHIHSGSRNTGAHRSSRNDSVPTGVIGGSPRPGGTHFLSGIRFLHRQNAPRQVPRSRRRGPAPEAPVVSPPPPWPEGTPMGSGEAAARILPFANGSPGPGVPAGGAVPQAPGVHTAAASPPPAQLVASPVEGPFLKGRASCWGGCEELGSGFCRPHLWQRSPAREKQPPRMGLHTPAATELRGTPAHPLLGQQTPGRKGDPRRKLRGMEENKGRPLPVAGGRLAASTCGGSPASCAASGRLRPLRAQHPHCKRAWGAQDPRRLCTR